MTLSRWLRERMLAHAEDRSQRFPETLLRTRTTGARPLSPFAMAAAILIGTLLGITSLRELEQWAAFDLRAIWILGGLTPDHSTFGRFILRLREGVSEELFERITQEALREVGRSIRDVSLDGTAIQAAVSRYRRLCAEAVAQQLAEARRDAQQAPEDLDHARKLERAEACAEALAEHQQRRRDSHLDPATVTVCPADPEVVVQKLKEGNFAPCSIASVIATEDRFVVAAQVHPSSEIAVVAPMLDQATRMAAAVNGPRGELAFVTNADRPPTHCGIEVLRADSNYLNGTVLREEDARGIEMRVSVGALARSTPAPQGFSPTDPRAFDKSRFRLVMLPANDYAPERACMVCPMGAYLLLASRDGARGADPAHETYRAVGVRCGVCPYQSRCAPKNPRRRVAHYPDDRLKERMRNRLATLAREERAGRRAASVEPVFSAVKEVQGLRRFRRRGTTAVQVEWHLHLIAHNLRRMMSLAKWRSVA